MKKVFILVLFVVPFLVFAQETDGYDKVLMNNGEEKIGKVTGITQDDIQFVHKGETLSYTLSKKDINKIEFSSGRIEFMNKNAAEPVQNNPQEGINLQDHHNVAAVLPFQYLSNEGGNMTEKMGTRVQEDCINTFKAKTRQLKFADPITINAILRKHGINEENITTYTPEEIAHILNVEYVIYGTVTVKETGATVTSSNYFNAKDKGRKVSGYSTGTTSSSTQYETIVEMNIYNEHNESIFSMSHESFWQTDDAYLITLQYIIKRSPFYSK